ncbi:hypothetical protein ACIBO4_39470 [Streptomyces sp. NPDC050149]|uniref:hypothetical protein n=1 Tax=Streptomyces sp. NPDC050149 TaxID=3365603 RepID=UPI00378D2208
MFLDKSMWGRRMGRPLGVLKGQTEQANDFARWLRKITAGVTVRTLEADFPYSKSAWSGLRDGSRLPNPELVEQVAVRYLGEPAMRERQLAHGIRLLQAAQQAAKALVSETSQSVPVPVPRRGDPIAAAMLRLDDARLRQIEAIQKLAASERRRGQLEDMVSVLEERCAVLESERDRAREDAQAELQRELQVSLEYRRQADEKLEHARRAEEKAFQLRLAAEKQVTLERMALRQIDQDAAGETVRPTVSGLSMAQELGLPPLEQIHELLRVAQEQLDAQDNELDELDEQIGLGAQHNTDDHADLSARILQGHIVDSAVTAAGHDVSEHRVDNAGKPVTSKNEGGTASAIEGAASDRTRAIQASNSLRGQSTELVIGLEAGSTPAALSTALSKLLRRAGAGSIATLTQETFSGKDRDDLLLMVVMRWIDGEDLPDSWSHLEALVRAMGATDREVEAFRQAYTRITSHDSALDPTHDLADLMPIAPRKRDLSIAVLGPCAIATLTTGYTAGLQAAQGPGLGKLVGYGALFLLSSVLVLMAVAYLTTPSAKAGKRVTYRRPVGISLLAFPAGLVIPWVVGSDAAGRWFADLVGLV